LPSAFFSLVGIVSGSRQPEYNTHHHEGPQRIPSYPQHLEVTAPFHFPSLQVITASHAA
jgi:hypothetical protein